MDINDSFALLFAEIYLCKLNILLTFHYMILRVNWNLYKVSTIIINKFDSY